MAPLLHRVAIIKKPQDENIYVRILLCRAAIKENLVATSTIKTLTSWCAHIIRGYFFCRQSLSNDKRKSTGTCYTEIAKPY